MYRAGIPPWQAQPAGMTWYDINGSTTVSGPHARVERLSSAQAESSFRRQLRMLPGQSEMLAVPNGFSPWKRAKLPNNNTISCHCLNTVSHCASESRRVHTPLHRNCSVIKMMVAYILRLSTLSLALLWANGKIAFGIMITTLSGDDRQQF